MISVERATRINDNTEKIDTYFRELELEKFRTMDERFYVIRINGEIVASVAYHRANKLICKVLVDEKHRRKGFGSLLLKHCEIVHAQCHPNTPIHAFIKQDNIASQQMFKKNGYELALSEGGFYRAEKHIETFWRDE